MTIEDAFKTLPLVERTINKTVNIFSSTIFSSTIVISLFWIVGYWYTFFTYGSRFSFLHVLIFSTLLLILLSFLSIIPLFVYTLFRYVRQYQVSDKTYTELSHYNLLTQSMRSEIEHSSRLTYHISNYRVAIPFTTFTLALGWFLFFFWPGQYNIADFFITGRTETLLIAESFHPIVFGFLGVVFWYEGSLFHRYVRGDLTGTFFLNIAGRILLVFLLTLVISVIWPGYSQPWLRVENIELHKGLLAISFLIGIFPKIGLDVIKKAALRSASWLNIVKREQLALDRIQGLELWDQGRLSEEGIDNVQNLAESDIFGLIVNTRLPIMALLHWVDQALLIMHVGKDLDECKSLGIITATDFEAAYVAQLSNKDDINKFLNKKNPPHLYSYMGREVISEVPEPPESLVSALGGGEDLKGRLRSMMSAICDDVNYQRLWQIRHGKLFYVEH